MAGILLSLLMSLEGDVCMGTCAKCTESGLLLLAHKVGSLSFDLIVGVKR